MLEEIRRQLGKDYVDVRPLSEGGMGTLFRAYRCGLGVDVVIKRVKTKYLGKLDQQAEANILKRIKHRYLPRIYDFIHGDDGYFYTVMDYIPGTNMQQYVKEHGPADQKTAHKWACQLCEVVAYLHEQTPPIIHCDIKPSNLMITPQGDICLIDFNTSLIFSDGVLALGATPGYAAPEQYTRKAQVQVPVQSEETEMVGITRTTEAGVADTNHPTCREVTLWASAQDLEGPDAKKGSPAEQVFRKEANQKELETPAVSGKPSFSAAVSSRAGGYGAVTKRTDVYGIGATLYYLVSGHVPERALDPLTPLHTYPLTISNIFSSIIERAMVKDPEGRFPDAACMLQALQDVDELDARFQKYRRMRRICNVMLGLLFFFSAACTVFGAVRLSAERDNTYRTLVSQGQALADQGNLQDAADTLRAAITAYPERADAYAALAAQLYEQGEYQQAYDLIRNAMDAASLRIESLPPEQAGDLLYIQANCLYEQQYYQEAADLYQQALTYWQENTAYYRGLALAQARSSRVDEAKNTLKTLESRDTNSLDCQIIRAEIDTVEGNYAAALNRYHSLASETEDLQVLGKICLSAAQICKQTGDLDGEIQWLTYAVERLGDNASMQEEMLADACTRKAKQDADNAAGWYEQARQHLQAVVDAGRGNILTELNLAVVEQSLALFSQAEQRLLKLQEQYPEDYRIYMRLAFLYADWQSKLPSAQRDYANTEKNYAAACQYYEQAVANGISDSEMTRLDALIQQLQVSGWL